MFYMPHPKPEKSVKLITIIRRIQKDKNSMMQHWDSNKCIEFPVPALHIHTQNLATIFGVHGLPEAHLQTGMSRDPNL